jgi:hypothetical protein
MRRRRNIAFVNELKILVKKKPEMVENPGPDTSGSIPADTEKPSPLLQEIQAVDQQIDDSIRAWSPTTS